MKSDLLGRVVALPETRELDRLAALLEAEGAKAWRCPMVSILDAPDSAPVEVWLKSLVADQLTDVIFLTGEGVRRLRSVAERMGLGQEFTASLARVRKITRGPKPARALKEMGLSTDIAARVPTSKGVMDELRELDLRGRSFGIQLYGQEPSVELCNFVREAGATVNSVAPYIYAPASDTARIVELIHALKNGVVDTIAFTSAAQVERFFEVGLQAGLEADLLRGLNGACVAAIGPIAAGALAQRGVSANVTPEKAFVMKRLVEAIGQAAHDDTKGA